MSASRNTSPVARVVVLGLALLGVSVAAIVIAPGGTAPLRAAPLWLPLVVARGVRRGRARRVPPRASTRGDQLLDLRGALALRVGVPRHPTRRRRSHRRRPHRRLVDEPPTAAQAAVQRRAVRVGDRGRARACCARSWRGPTSRSPGCSPVGSSPSAVVTVVGSLIVCAAIAQFEGDFFGKARHRAALLGVDLRAERHDRRAHPRPGAGDTVAVTLRDRADRHPLDLRAAAGARSARRCATSRPSRASPGASPARWTSVASGERAVDETTRLLRARQAGLVIFDGEVALMTVSAGAPLDGLPDRTDDPRWQAVLHHVDESTPGSIRVDDMCAVPVLSDQGVVGLLVVERTRGRNRVVHRRRPPPPPDARRPARRRRRTRPDAPPSGVRGTPRSPHRPRQPRRVRTRPRRDP